MFNLNYNLIRFLEIKEAKNIRMPSVEILMILAKQKKMRCHRRQRGPKTTSFSATSQRTLEKNGAGRVSHLHVAPIRSPSIYLRFVFFFLEGLHLRFLSVSFTFEFRPTTPERPTSGPIMRTDSGRIFLGKAPSTPVGSPVAGSRRGPRPEKVTTSTQ